MLLFVGQVPLFVGHALLSQQLLGCVQALLQRLYLTLAMHREAVL